MTLMPATPETVTPRSETAQIIVPTVDELVHDQQFYVVPRPCEDILRCTRNPSMHRIRRYVAAHDGSSA